MEDTQSFFEIELHHLKGMTIFPFHLYVFNQRHKKFTPFLKANSPLTAENIDFLNYIAQKGAKLAVQESQKLTFLSHLDWSEQEIISLQSEDIHPEEQKQKDLKRGKLKAPAPRFNLVRQFKQLELQGDYGPMVKAAKDEIELFSLRQSPTVSLSVFLAQELLTQDNILNRVVSFSYFLCKEFHPQDESILGDMVCASFLAHIGQTQYRQSLSVKAPEELTTQERLIVQRHINLTQYLLNKSKISLSSRCRQIILDHHELLNGQGYPLAKKADQLPLILGAACAVFDHKGNPVQLTDEIRKQMVIHYGENICLVLSDLLERNQRLDAA